MKPWEIVQKILLDIKNRAKIGMKLSELDVIAEVALFQQNAISCNKGYTGQDIWDEKVKPKDPFPTSIVCNVNSVVAHGHASDYVIRDGDTICIDLGVEKDGICGDGAITFGIGNVKKEHQKLLRYARLTTLEGITCIKAGQSMAEYGRIVENYAAKKGFVINQTFASHAIGTKMHEEPVIPNYRTTEYIGTYFEEGKMYCIEPILTYKDVWGMRAGDWAFVTRDGKRAAMFETQVLVTKTGCINLMPELLKP